MCASELDQSLIVWAAELLKACSLPEASLVERISLVDEFGICFVTRAPISGRLRAHTGLLKSTVKGWSVCRIVDGWNVPRFAGGQPLVWESNDG